MPVQVRPPAPSEKPRYTVENTMRRGFLFAYIQVGFDANGHNLGIIASKTTKNHQKTQQADMRIIAQYCTLFNNATPRISNT